MNYKEVVDKYITDVKSGNVVACKWVKLAVERHLKDLQRDDIYFDEDSAIKFLKFSSLCRYTKGELAKQKKRIEFLNRPENQICFIEGCNNPSTTIEHLLTDRQIREITIKLEDVNENELVLNGVEFSLTFSVHFQYQREMKELREYTLPHSLTKQDEILEEAVDKKG